MARKAGQTDFTRTANMACSRTGLCRIGLQRPRPSRAGDRKRLGIVWSQLEGRFRQMHAFRLITIFSNGSNTTPAAGQSLIRR